MSCFGRLAGAPWRGPRRLGMTLRVSAADPFGQLTGASVFVGGIALVKFSELRPWAGPTRRSPGAVCPALRIEFWG